MPSPSAPPSSVDELAEESFSNLLRAIERGLPTALADDVRERLDLSTEAMARLLGISSRTLERRREQGLLATEESERLHRVVRLLQHARQVLGTREDARSWLTQPQMRLGDRVPLEVARYEPGAREVERLLGRIEHGIPA